MLTMLFSSPKNPSFPPRWKFWKTPCSQTMIDYSTLKLFLTWELSMNKPSCLFISYSPLFLFFYPIFTNSPPPSVSPLLLFFIPFFIQYDFSLNQYYFIPPVLFFLLIYYAIISSTFYLPSFYLLFNLCYNISSIFTPPVLSLSFSNPFYDYLSHLTCFLSW